MNRVGGNSSPGSYREHSLKNREKRVRLNCLKCGRDTFSTDVGLVLLRNNLNKIY